LAEHLDLVEQIERFEPFEHVALQTETERNHRHNHRHADDHAHRRQRCAQLRLSQVS
jgi:hypothetical protein